MVLCLTDRTTGTGGLCAEGGLGYAPLFDGQSQVVNVIQAGVKPKVLALVVALVVSAGDEPVKRATAVGDADA